MTLTVPFAWTTAGLYSTAHGTAVASAGGTFQAETDSTSTISAVGDLSGVCMISSVTPGLVLLQSAGVCTINAAGTNGGSAQQTITIGVRITSTPPSLIVGQMYTPVSDSSSSTTFTIDSSTASGVCSIDGVSHVISFLQAGNCYVKATSNQQVSTLQQVTIVNGAPPSFSVDAGQRVAAVRTLHQVEKGEELLVAYGSQYWRFSLAASKKGAKRAAYAAGAPGPKKVGVACIAWSGKCTELDLAHREQSIHVCFRPEDQCCMRSQLDSPWLFNLRIHLVSLSWRMSHYRYNSGRRCGHIQLHGQPNLHGAAKLMPK